MADSPTAAYCDWLEALPPAVSDDLGLSLIRLFPGGALKSTLITGRPTDGLAPRIRRLASTREADVGVAATLAALTDLILIERGDPEYWRQSEALLGLLDQAQEVLGESDLGPEAQQWIEENKLRYPLRARQWLKQRDGWSALRQGPLEPTRLAAALRSPPTGPSNPG